MAEEKAPVVAPAAKPQNVNKWEGEDEEEDVKVSKIIHINVNSHRFHDQLFTLVYRTAGTLKRRNMKRRTKGFLVEK